MKNTLIRAAWIFLTLIAMFFTGCSTLRGVGQDIEKGGEAIQRAATRK